MASAVPSLIESDPAHAARVARQLGAAAEQAAAEARGLIVDLRQDDLERPLGEALEEAAQGWGRRTGTTVDVDIAPCEGLSPSVRYELFSIAREALRNAYEHGGAGHVHVRREDGPEVALVVADDGQGFAVPGELAALADAGQFGVIGMLERAESVGGRLELTSRPGEGTTIEVLAPRAAPGQTEGQRRPPASKLEATS